MAPAIRQALVAGVLLGLALPGGAGAAAAEMSAAPIAPDADGAGPARSGVVPAASVIGTHALAASSPTAREAHRPVAGDRAAVALHPGGPGRAPADWLQPGTARGEGTAERRGAAGSRAPSPEGPGFYRVADAGGAQPAESPEPSLEGAMEAWAAGDLPRARVELDALVDAEPDNLEARMRLAGLHLSRGRYRDGIHHYQEAIGLDPDNDRAFIGLGLAYLHAGESGPAHAAFEEAVRLNPARYKDLEPLMQKLTDRQPHPVPHVDGEDPSEAASAQPFMPPHGWMGR